jgi:branched-chain amino acid transport system permease protein
MVVVFLLASAPYWLIDAYWTRQFLLIALLALVVSGLNLTFGWAGELSLGQPFMYAAGAYAGGYLTIHYANDLLLSMSVGALAALVAGVVSGVPGLRLGGWMLAITSFFLVMLIPSLVRMVPNDALGGTLGMLGIPEPAIFGAILDSRGLYFVVVLVAGIWFAALRNLLISRTGIAFLTMRHSPVLAASLGISVYRYKLLAYAIGAIPAGIAGALFAQVDQFFATTSFPLSMAISVLAASIIGGTSSIYGAIVGATVIHLFQTQSTDFEDFALIGYGALLIVGGVLFSGGVAGLVALLRRRLRRADPPTAASADGQAAAALPEMAGLPLTVTDVGKSFGGAQALAGVSLTAAPGRITALIGPNGSGKTTLLNAISGMIESDSGSVRLGEHDLTGRPSYAIARFGVSRTFQTPMVPERLLVREVVASGRTTTQRIGPVATVLRLPSYRRTVRDDDAAVTGILAALDLGHLADRPAAELALGTRRLVELARALATGPALLLLDEVASGLDTAEISDLMSVLERVRAAGTTVVLVEHNFGLVRLIADHVVVLADGRVIADGTPAEIVEHPEVLERYLGAGAGISGTTVQKDERS